MKYLLTFTCILCFAFKSQAQQSDYQLITQDAMHFWEAIDSLKTHKDTVNVFQRLVFNRASPAFQIFVQKWHIKASDYAAQIRRYPKFYSTLRASTVNILAHTDSVQLLVDRFRSQYPNFKPANICIGFGNFSTGGNMAITQSGNYVYVGLEFHGLDEYTDVSELSAAMQDYLSRGNFFRTVIHELVHVQQYTHGRKVAKSYHGNSLHTTILREGIPDFIGQLIYPGGRNGNNYRYGLANESDLKQKLYRELYGSDFSFWIYNYNTVTYQPRDLGYFMGARIARNYYNAYLAEKKDLTDLIEIRNSKNFIKKSRYFDQI